VHSNSINNLLNIKGVKVKNIEYLGEKKFLITFIWQSTNLSGL